MNNKLPIGSVVILKGSTQEIMITGYKTKELGSDIVYDYNGCIFPEGFMEEKYLLFNSSQIEKVIFMGYQVDESLKYSSKVFSAPSNKVKALDRSRNVRRTTNRVGSRRPTKSLSKSEMLNKYGVEKISGENIKRVR